MIGSKKTLRNSTTIHSNVHHTYGYKKTRLVSFTLVVYDFGIKYSREYHMQNIINSFKKNTSSQWIGAEKILGLEIYWNYQYQHVIISMPNYINQSLHKFQHPLNPKPTKSLSK